MEKTHSYTVPAKPATYIFESWLVFILLAFPFGIVPLSFGWSASKNYKKGEYEAAARASSRARLWLIICTVYGAISTVLLIIGMITGKDYQILSKLL